MSTMASHEARTRDCVRSLIANTSGYLYRPDYEYAHLRTEPPCQHPEYSAYSKKQMREMREEERRRKREGDRVEAVAPAFVRPDVEVMDVSAIDSFGAAMTDEVEDTASSLLPNIQRLSVIGDLDSEDEDGKEESVLPVDESLFHPLGVKPLKRKASLLTKASSKSDMTIVPPGRSNSPGAASVVTTVHCGGEVQKVLAPQAANDASHSPSPVKFIRPPQPFNYEGSSSSGSPLPLRRLAGGISKNTEMGSSSIDLLLDGGNFVDPWPDLWTEYRHKPPKLSEKDWKIVNSCLGPLGMPDYGTIPPSDPENREAYKNIRKLLRDSWLVMTGQISPTECDATNTLLKPFLEKEEQEKKAKFEVLEQKLKLRKKALRIPEPSAKRSSGGDYSRRLSIPGTPVMQSSSAMSSPPPIPGSSPFPSFSSESFGESPALTTDGSSKRSSVQSGEPPSGSQTPSKRERLKSFTNLLSKIPKTPRSPKQGNKAHRKSGSIEKEDVVVTTPVDAPPIPAIPATFSGKNTYATTAFESAPATTRNMLSQAKKISISFGPGSSFSEPGTNTTSRQPSMSFPSTASGDGGKKKTPLKSEDTPLSIEVLPNRTASGSFGSVTASGRGTPVIDTDFNPFSPCPSSTPAMAMTSPASSLASTVDFSAVQEHQDQQRQSIQHAHTHSRHSSGGGSSKHNSSNNKTGNALDIFDAHLSELLREFHAWDTGAPSSAAASTDAASSARALALLDTALQPLEKAELDALPARDRATLLAALAALTPADLHLAAAHALRARRYPAAHPSRRRATTFAALPALALRIAAAALAAANAAYLPRLDPSYELANHAHAARERAWRAAHPEDPHYPGAGVSRPAERGYLRAGYACAWAVRFVGWAREGMQVWEWENVDVVAERGMEKGGGLRRAGRTREVRGLLDMVDQRVSVEMETGELKVEGEGAVLSVEEVERRLEALAEREAERGMGRVWRECEGQLRRLGGLMASGTQE
ncbi:hypothetical protein B0J12DRAFT_728282 [Macrophomina phaseolina]|uniref:Uncharacterized protein n=1 Tax=Macrophomina phaseolina TaxID=35725 RepID=A0ABQ8GCA0_9PEZI|nr:hypothetical protein B0J12DRAFT_728282 [Macrophomina phaseolina]